jgi:hypothetical protein
MKIVFFPAVGASASEPPVGRLLLGHSRVRVAFRVRVKVMVRVSGGLPFRAFWSWPHRPLHKPI